MYWRANWGRRGASLPSLGHRRRKLPPRHGCSRSAALSGLGASNVPVVTSDARGDPVTVAGNAALEVVVGSRRRPGLRAGGASDSGGSSNRPHRDLTPSSPVILSFRDCLQVLAEAVFTAALGSAC